MHAPQYHNRANERTKNPRRVRGGVKMPSTERASESWAGQRWLRLVESGASPTIQAEALEYASLGQTRSLSYEPGEIVALVQGRAPRAYRVKIQLGAFTESQWDGVLASMSDQARYAAKLLAGDLPTNIEELFAPLGLHLYPMDHAELVPSCTCDEAKADPKTWCKHATCAALLTADQLAQNPWLVFTIRGMEKSEVLERLQQSRLVPTSGDGSAPVYAPHVAAVEALSIQPLEESLGQFWEQPASLEHLHLTIEKPAVSHPLLRRLGQSPFEQSRFPLVGLLATCYDIISEQVLAREEAGQEADDSPSDRPSDSQGSGPDN